MPEREGRVAELAAIEALREGRARQRLLRSAYMSARYGWPESPAPEWVRRPQSFASEAPDRVATLLEAFVAEELRNGS